VKTVLPDTMKVVLDYNYAKKSEKDAIDTGLFRKIYEGEPVNQSQKTVGQFSGG